MREKRQKGARGGGRGRKGGRRGNRGKEARGWIFQAAPPWQRSQRIAMATDPETPSGRRTTIASERASLSDGSNNVSSLLLLLAPVVDVGRRTQDATAYRALGDATHAAREMLQARSGLFIYAVPGTHSPISRAPSRNKSAHESVANLRISPHDKVLSVQNVYCICSDLAFLSSPVI